MPRVHPFRAWMYDPGRVPSLDHVVTQPYDKIDETLRRTYLARHPKNAVRLIQSREDPALPGVSRYEVAARTFRDWRQDGTFVRHPVPAFYASAVTYRGPDGAERTRRALTVLLSLEAPGGGVRAHERTLAGPKADRLNLLRAARAHFGQIFLLYEDPEQRVESSLEGRTEVPPLLRARDDDGCEHVVWAVSEPRIVEEIVQVLGDRVLMIADGHHRYETAVAYRDEQRAAGAGSAPDASHERVLVTLVNASDPGLSIFPTHRLVHDVAGWDPVRLRGRLAASFDVADASGADPARFLADLPADGWGFGVAVPGAGGGVSLWRAALRKGVDPAKAIPGPDPAAVKRLDVSVLHQMVLGPILGIDAAALSAETNVHYVRHAADAVEAVRTGKAQGAFLLRPTPVSAVRDCAAAGARMPQKSTDFYPKLLSGLMIYALDAP